MVDVAAQPGERVVGGSTRDQPRWARRVAINGGMVALGVALVAVGTVGLDSVTAWPRWLFALAGIAVCFRGLNALGQMAFGRGFRLGLWLSLLWLGALLFCAIFAPVLGFQKPTYLPLTESIYQRPDLFSAHLLGTDGFGRGELSRIIYGARVSLLLGFGCTAVALFIGTTLGVWAGYYRGALDRVIAILTDTVLAFPALILLLALVSALQPSIHTLFIALSLLLIPVIVRLARANTLLYAEKEFTLASRAIGAKDRRIIRRELLPNLVWPLISYGMVLVAVVIVAEASLSFLGLGIKAPYPTWGNMIAENENVFQQHPYTILVPAIVLFITVLACNYLGEVKRTGVQRQAAGL